MVICNLMIRAWLLSITLLETGEGGKRKHLKKKKSIYHFSFQLLKLNSSRFNPPSQRQNITYTSCTPVPCKISVPRGLPGHRPNFYIPNWTIISHLSRGLSKRYKSDHSLYFLCYFRIINPCFINRKIR